MTWLLMLVACDREAPAGEPEPVVINEFVASNAASWIDEEDGSAPDWVELTNVGDTPVDLTGATFSDDITDPAKWEFPAGTSIAPGDYLLVLCDGDELLQGGMHTSFSLQADGEQIGLYGADGTPWDEVDYDAQVTDISAARVPDGTGDFVADPTPTPLAANDGP